MNAGKTRRWWARGALTLAVLAVGLDGTILSVALPTLATDLHASTADLQWFVSGYTLVLAAALLPAGLLGDRYGRKKILLGALVLFGVGSVAVAYAPSAGAFIGARVLLGLGAAAVIPLSLSVLTVLFSPQERPRAVGVWAAANFLALPLGPILGGWLLTNYWWGWAFLINLPVVLVGLLAVAVLLPESRSATRTGLDPVGVLSSSAGLAVVVYGVIEAGQHGWETPPRSPPWPPGRCCWWASGSGSAGWAGARMASPWSTWGCSGPPASPGARSWPRWASSRCLVCCSPHRSTSRQSLGPTPWVAACGCCR